MSEPSLPIIDCHVHMVGNGSGGSGCWIRVGGRFLPQAKALLYSLGLPQSALHGPLEDLYIERLLSFLSASSVKAVVLLAHELTRDENGRPIDGFGSFHVPNEVVLALGKKHPQILPAVSIHPARSDALDELERALDGGAVMMKCLPNCHNINLSDPRYTRFFERMAEAKLPLLAHTGGEFSLPVYDHRYESPEFLKLPLEIGVTVVGAHCGTKSLFFGPDFKKQFAELLARYPNLYGDNSGMLTPIRCQHLRVLTKSPFEERIVYGSDMPIPISGIWPWLWRLVGREVMAAAGREKNLLERDLLLKRAMGFSEASFRRGGTILRLSESQRQALLRL